MHKHTDFNQVVTPTLQAQTGEWRIYHLMDHGLEAHVFIPRDSDHKGLRPDRVAFASPDAGLAGGSEMHDFSHDTMDKNDRIYLAHKMMTAMPQSRDPLAIVFVNDPARFDFDKANAARLINIERTVIKRIASGLHRFFVPLG